MVRSYRLIALCLTLFALTPLLSFAGSAPSVGTMAPEFTLNSQEGAPVSLKDYRGKWVVLYFYPKDFRVRPEQRRWYHRRHHDCQRGIFHLGSSANHDLHLGHVGCRHGNLPGRRPFQPWEGRSQLCGHQRDEGRLYNPIRQGERADPATVSIAGGPVQASLGRGLWLFSSQPAGYRQP